LLQNNCGRVSNSRTQNEADDGDRAHTEDGVMPIPDKRTIAQRIYSKLKQPTEPDQPKRPPVDGWAPQRKAWGENVDHRARGHVSPLGGQVKRGK
jgi:hypothetical protein